MGISEQCKEAESLLPQLRSKNTRPLSKTVTRRAVVQFQETPLSKRVVSAGRLRKASKKGPGMGKGNMSEVRQNFSSERIDERDFTILMPVWGSDSRAMPTMIGWGARYIEIHT